MIKNVLFILFGGGIGSALRYLISSFFNKSFAMTKNGGTLFIDNIMFRGFLYKEYPKRYKTIVKKLNLFIEELYKNHNFVLLPFGDGVGLVRKI